MLRGVRLLMDVGTTTTSLVLVGPESAGKTALAAGLTATRSAATNVAGDTVAIETRHGRGLVVHDTPGLQLRGDTAASAATLQRLDARRDEVVVLVVRATSFDDDLHALLPVVGGRHGMLVVTNADRIADRDLARSAFGLVAAAVGVPIVLLDARDPSGSDVAAIRAAAIAPGHITTGPVLARAGLRVQPPATVLEHRRIGPPLGLLVLVGPATLAVTLAVSFAARLDPLVVNGTARLAERAAALPSPFGSVLADDYGLLMMGPLLLVWALPTILALALVLATLKASGLLDRTAGAVHPWVGRLGLTGRDLVRVVAGHGCNVPAVIASRSCSSCTRDATVGAIAIGAACSFQLAATISVLATARRPALVVPYLGLLLLGAMVQTRWLRRGQPADLELLHGRAFLVRPRVREVWAEAQTTLRHVTLRALPVFAGVVVLASLAASSGVLDAASRVVAPILGALRLPGEAALPVVMASVRKDGVLLAAEPSLLAGLDGTQLLALLVLAGAALPCAVTMSTMVRERGMALAARIVGQQLAVIVSLAAGIAWLGPLLSWMTQ